MSIYEVPQPRLNSPFEQPKEHWNILKGEVERLAGRRRSLYYYRDPKELPQRHERRAAGIGIGMIMVNRIRQHLAQWRLADYAGVTDTTRELLGWWRRVGRKHRLFFAQLEATETIIFLRGHRKTNGTALTPLIPLNPPCFTKRRALPMPPVGCASP